MMAPCRWTEICWCMNDISWPLQAKAVATMAEQYCSTASEAFFGKGLPSAICCAKTLMAMGHLTQAENQSRNMACPSKTLPSLGQNTCAACMKALASHGTQSGWESIHPCLATTFNSQDQCLPKCQTPFMFTYVVAGLLCNDKFVWHLWHHRRRMLTR